MVGIWLFLDEEIVTLKDLAYISNPIKKNREKNMKISAADLNTLSARTTIRVLDVLNTQMSS